MTLEESEPNTSSDHILDWLDSLEGSIPFLPPFLDDPYNSGQINGDHWWVENQDLDPELVHPSSTYFNNSTSTITTATSTTPPDLIPSNNLQPSDPSKKRKGSDNPAPKPSQSHRKNQNRRNNEADDGDGVKRAVGGKKGSAKSAGNNCSNGNNREGRWAEQLLNPCAAAVTAGNLTRVQHLLYVLHELASPSGDANHRLAAHGLRALTHLLSSPVSSVSQGPINFSSTKPQFFQKSLMRFDEVSPWFMFPNKIANNSILQILSEQDQSRNLHILDIGVSHGVQWPTLLEALSRRSGGAPPLVRLTVVGAATDLDRITDNPFVISPPGYSFTSQLLCYAKSININLQINRLDNLPLQNLNAEIINFSPDETLIVCAQFRLHHLNHNHPDNRTEFLQVLRNLEPKGVVLSENNTDCSCTSCGDFAAGFSRRVEYLWRFLDSSSAAFKGRESDERRVMEGEASKALLNSDEMNEGKEKWCERMRRVGFAGQVLGEDTIDEARALLRKYDSNWEMRAEEKDGCVGLWWKGQPVSFCSLWKLGDESK
ncbi:Nodulation-signaling pathway 1 protein [Actinidia chinensis var. chinensis]|uniref:Nodulation-signaling pathway 1 protein n=1 Tax=Actinidia chinensis var. chinensis TaxID=1590841 RepID=A0A2R6R0F6_ACTCC|nr:Nodulation-signaling pathway 1 protein [Actinidia chinensis var. chinensis]